MPEVGFNLSKFWTAEKLFYGLFPSIVMKFKKK